MRIDGLWFNDKDRKQMIRTIKSSLDSGRQKTLLPLIISAMELSASRGINGERDATATIETHQFRIVANVCCGGYAELIVKEVEPIIE